MTITTINQFQVTLLSSSISRRAKEFFGIIESALRAIQSFFVSIPLAKERFTALRTAAETDYKAGNCFGAVLALQSGQCLSGSHLQTYAETFNSNVSFCSDFCEMNLGRIDRLPELPDLDKELLAIPIVVKGAFRNHVLIVMIDKKNRLIEFYDSKGLTIQDRASDTLVNFPKRSIKELMTKICDDYFTADWSLLENQTRHQSDGYNCGVYVSDYLKRRSEGETFEDIVNNGLSFSEASYSSRLDMMNRIIR